MQSPLLRRKTPHQTPVKQYCALPARKHFNPLDREPMVHGTQKPHTKCLNCWRADRQHNIVHIESLLNSVVHRKKGITREKVDWLKIQK